MQRLSVVVAALSFTVVTYFADRRGFTKTDH
jgi:hypothetical protein